MDEASVLRPNDALDDGRLDSNRGGGSGASAAPPPQRVLLHICGAEDGVPARTRRPREDAPPPERKTAADGVRPAVGGGVKLAAAAAAQMLGVGVQLRLQLKCLFN